MRAHKLNTVLESNVDLTIYSNSRVKIEKIEDGKFLITSTLKFYSCELRKWAFNFIKSQLPNKSYKYFTGNCSTPCGIFV